MELLHDDSLAAAQQEPTSHNPRFQLDLIVLGLVFNCTAYLHHPLSILLHAIAEESQCTPISK
jgi:hypothetical protein